MSKKKASITVIILTHNEEIHIERCISSLLPIVENVFVVDSFSTDKTVDIAKSLGAVVVQRKWINYADQFQWGLDNCENKTEWIMRMDSDEYLEPDLQFEIERRLSLVDSYIDGIYLNRKHIFFGKWIRHGGRFPLTLLRIWRTGKGRIEQRWMDEHIILSKGAKTLCFRENIVDDNLKGITFFVNKHNSYATREAVDILNYKYGLYERDDGIKENDKIQAKYKRILKANVYSKLPIGLRAILYFLLRYFFQLGFLDGWKGFVYHFMQGLWYRLLVDVKVYEIEKAGDKDAEKIKEILNKDYGIDLVLYSN